MLNKRLTGYIDGVFTLLSPLSHIGESHGPDSYLATHHILGSDGTPTRDTWTCCPLYRWSGKDIWAYIVGNNLPYLKMYDAAGEDRERLRSEFTYLVGDAIWRHGVGVFIKRHNPRLWNYIKLKWPEIERWG